MDGYSKAQLRVLGECRGGLRPWVPTSCSVATPVAPYLCLAVGIPCASFPASPCASRVAEVDSCAMPWLHLARLHSNQTSDSSESLTAAEKH